MLNTIKSIPLNIRRWGNERKELKELIDSQNSESIKMLYKDDIYGKHSIHRVFENKSGRSYENFSTDDIIVREYYNG